MPAITMPSLLHELGENPLGMSTGRVGRPATPGSHRVGEAPAPAAVGWVRYYNEGPGAAATPPPHSMGLSHTGYVSENDLRALDAKVEAQARAVDVAVAQCPTLPPADQVLWSQTFATWQQNHDATTKALASSINVLGLGYAALADSLSNSEQDIQRAQDRVHAACPSKIGPSNTGTSTWQSTILTIAILGAVLLGAWMFAPLLIPALRRS